MRTFIVLCLIAATCADKLGYNYKPVAHSDFGLSFSPGGLATHVSGGHINGFGHQGNSGSIGGGSSFVGPVSSFGGGSVPFNTGSSFGSGIGSSGVVGSVGSGNFGGNVGGSYNTQPELEKEFYTFTANENDFSAPHVDNQVFNSGKRGIRVIFIKGPEHNGLENAAVALAKHIAEQKTAIYVLQKQTDLGSLSQKLNVINNNVNHKPEVHFVKYRTHEDAINAQKAIQGQYDSLGGVSSSYDGGEVPVLNFASKTLVASHGSHGSLAPSGSVESSDSHGSFGSSGSLGSVSGSFESSAPMSSSGLSSISGSFVPPSAPSSSYLPA